MGSAYHIFPEVGVKRTVYPLYPAALYEITMLRPANVEDGVGKVRVRVPVVERY